MGRIDLDSRLQAWHFQYHHGNTAMIYDRQHFQIPAIALQAALGGKRRCSVIPSKSSTSTASASITESSMPLDTARTHAKALNNHGRSRPVSSCERIVRRRVQAAMTRTSRHSLLIALASGEVLLLVPTMLSETIRLDVPSPLPV